MKDENPKEEDARKDRSSLFKAAGLEDAVEERGRKERMSVELGGRIEETEDSRHRELLLEDRHGRVRREIDAIEARVSGGESGRSSHSSDLEDETRRAKTVSISNASERRRGKRRYLEETRFPSSSKISEASERYSSCSRSELEESRLRRKKAKGGQSEKRRRDTSFELTRIASSQFSTTVQSHLI